MFVTLHCVIQEVSELVLPIAVHIVENVPWEKHAHTQPATNKKHEVVFVLGRLSLPSRALALVVVIHNPPPLSEDQHSTISTSADHNHGTKGH